MSDHEQRIDRFFDRHLLPLVNVLEAAGVRHFPAGADPGVESYYRAPDDPAPALKTIEPTELAADLTALWATADPALLPLVEPLAELAMDLREEETEATLSPFIYVMF
ncbi:MAG: hypothetical protein HQL82_04595 [Magnetococcales bacterium]|nr:hypothetical protein [Magnetococcales bacterium]